MKPNYEVVLRYLHQDEDRSLELIKGYTYAIIDGRLCILLRVGEPAECMWVEADMSVNSFFAQCEQMSDEEVTLLAANIALNLVKCS